LNSVDLYFYITYIYKQISCATPATCTPVRATTTGEHFQSHTDPGLIQASELENFIIENTYGAFKFSMCRFGCPKVFFSYKFYVYVIYAKWREKKNFWTTKSAHAKFKRAKANKYERLM
jgi:hypothetical protein